VRVPLFGAWRRQALAATFARMVGELLAGGAPLLAALADARDCISDPVARAETERIRTRVREGSSLNAAIGERSVFPAVLPQLVALGEEAGGEGGGGDRQHGGGRTGLGEQQHGEGRADHRRRAVGELCEHRSCHDGAVLTDSSTNVSWCGLPRRVEG